MTRTDRNRESTMVRMQRSRLARSMRRRLAPGRRWLGGRYEGRPRRLDQWIVGPPDFVGVGVQKAGTSWWFEAICEHPEVHWAGDRPKELHFFDPYWATPFTGEDVAAYHELFARPSGHVVGEWTPRYMADHWTPRLLAKAAPESRLLVMLRDPVERYLSGLTHSLSRGAPAHPIVAGDAFIRGLYASQLVRLFRYFERSQVLVLQYERCSAEPENELERTLSFLELSPFGHSPAVLDSRINPTTSRKATLDEDGRRALVEAYAHDVLELAGMDLDLDLSLWPNFAAMV